MSGEAAKERVTYAYMRVPSKSKSLKRELPNMEVGCSIKHRNDDTETHVFCDSKVRSYTQASAVVVWPSHSERVRAKVICLEKARCGGPPSL